MKTENLDSATRVFYKFNSYFGKPKFSNYALISSELIFGDALVDYWTRVCTVTGYYSTTRPLVLLNLVKSITYSYFGHAVLPKPLTFRSPLDLKK